MVTFPLGLRRESPPRRTGRALSLGRTCIEAGRRTGAPTTLLSDRPIGDPAGDLEVADALANWERLVAEGEANVRKGVLYLISPEMTDDEWAAQVVTEH
jgi:hypothetical protein